MPRVFIVCNPHHNNLGDQAQLMCIEKWIKDYLPQYKMIKLGSIYTPFDSGWRSHILSSGLLKLIYLKLFLKKDDIFLGQSGYLMQDGHTGWFSFWTLMHNFPKQKMIVFPQTVNFKADIVKRYLQSDFDKSNILLMCRDEVSYNNAQQIFRRTKLLLYPDIVTSLIGTRKYEGKRDGILFILRNDSEKYYSDEDLNKLMKRCSENYNVKRIDTNINLNSNKSKNIHDAIYRYIDDIAQYKAVITDRYHGTIFSMVANTPTVVLKSIDHKLTSGVDWYPKDLFGDRITMANDLDEAFTKVMVFVNLPQKDPTPAYFKDNYWSKLKEKVF